MANFFYYDANGTKQGPIAPQELQDLVVQGIVTPQTPLETDTGHKGKAGQIKGLQFPKPYEPADPFSETIPDLSAQVRPTSASVHVQPNGHFPWQRWTEWLRQNYVRVTIIAFIAFFLLNPSFNPLSRGIIIRATIGFNKRTEFPIWFPADLYDRRVSEWSKETLDPPLSFVSFVSYIGMVGSVGLFLYFHNQTKRT